MKKSAPIGYGMSWNKSDGGETIYVPNFNDYKMKLGKEVCQGEYIRRSPIKIMNVSSDSMILYHYGWCCRSLELMKEKAEIQTKSQAEGWGSSCRHQFLHEDSPLLVDFKGKHPREIERLIEQKGGGWKFA